MSSERPEPASRFESGTIHGIVREVANRFADRSAVLYKDGSGKYQPITYGELAGHVDRVAAALKSQGIKRGDRVAICAYHGPDWVIADLAILTIGGIVVPIYHTLSPALVAHILRDSQTRLVFVEDAKVFDAVQSIKQHVPDLGTVVVFDDTAMERRPTFLRFSAMKAGTAKPSCDAIEEEVSPDATATIVYTSGTTGEPKGVVLSHSNIVTNALASVERFHVTPSDAYLSFLPLCHVLERTAGCYAMLFAGATLAYAGGVATILDDVQVIRPTILIAVPRIVEKIYEAVERGVMEGSPIRKRMVLDAVRTLNRRVNLEYKGLRVPLWLRLGSRFYDRFAASKLRAIAGGRLRFIISAGAPLDRKLAKTLWVLGFKILQGYGLTETSPAVSTTSLEDNRLGTVGKPYPGVEVRIGEDDEILVRGPNVMKGYHNRPEETAAAIDREGWFHTGDQGRFDERGNLVITGRIKELIVTSYGKNVAPVPIETELAHSPYVDQAMLCGDKRKHIAALIVPARAAVMRRAEEMGIKAGTYAGLLRQDGIRSLLAGEIERATSGCAPYEKVRAFVLLSEGFTVENDLLTPTLKLRRGRIEERYRAEIASIYSGET
jgi:long-chain acyl-CoA synthetase